MYIVVTNNVSEGSCVSQGGTASYKKKWNLYIFVQQNALIDIKISTIDICLTKYSPKNPKLWCVLYFINEKFNKNAKVEQLTKVVLSHGEEKGLIVKDPWRKLTTLELYL